MKQLRPLAFWHFKHIVASAIVVLGFAVIGVLTLQQSQAATHAVTAEAESGSLTGNVAPIFDGSASAGGGVQFGLNPGGSSCALPNYPNASCTGVPAGTTLTNYNTPCTPPLLTTPSFNPTSCSANAVDGSPCTTGREDDGSHSATGRITATSCDINVAGRVIDSKNVRGCLAVHAPSVIIRRSKVNCPNFGVILSHNDYSGTGVLIEDTQISCSEVDIQGNADSTKPTNGTGVGDNNFTVRRSSIFGCENGFDIDKNVTIEDSYIHHLASVGGDPHTDGIQITPVGENVTIRHNTIYSYNPDDGLYGTSSIISPRVSDGILHNILIQDNLMAGGGYTLYCPVGGSGVNYRVINNHFSRIFNQNVGFYAPWTDSDCRDETQVTGNVYHETGQPVPL